jgi:hypothetical protein
MREGIKKVRINPNFLAQSRVRKFTLWVSNSFTSRISSHVKSYFVETPLKGISETVPCLLWLQAVI